MYWQSHGCDLPSKHPEPYHQCGLGEDEDSTIDWDETVQVWRRREANGWPVHIFGDDAPGGWDDDDSHAEDVLSSEGRMNNLPTLTQQKESRND